MFERPGYEIYGECNMRSRPAEWGFTLIEIMVVVVILGILAALVTPAVISRIDDAQINRAKQDIRTIESALKMYRLDNYKYPTTEQGLEALVRKPNDSTVRNWQEGGYLERMPVDPWSGPYQYLHPGTRSALDIYTLGADAQQGGEGIDQDIGNWDLN